MLFVPIFGETASFVHHAYQGPPCMLVRELGRPQLGMPPHDSPMPPQRNPPHLLEHMMDVVPTPTQPSNPRSQADSKFSFSIARVAASKHSIRMRSFPPNAWVFSEKIRKPFISKKEEVGTRGSPPSFSCCCYYSGAKGKRKGEDFYCLISFMVA